VNGLPGGVRPADVVAYTLAVVVLVGGGAIFTRGILTFNRGPALAVAVIVTTGWVADRLARRRQRGAPTDEMADGTSDGTADGTSDQRADGTSDQTADETADDKADAPTSEAP
jgi:hypothetical protein